MRVKIFNRKTLAAPLLAFLLVGIFTPVLSFGQALDPEVTGVSMDLRLVPTSLVISPAQLSIGENAAAQNFVAMAFYDYPDAPEPIPPRDVSNDSETIWSTSNPSAALVNTVGLVTPVSDLNTTSAPVVISATYGGVAANSNVTVTGVLPPTPPPPTPPSSGSGQSGGRGSFGNPPPASDGGVSPVTDGSVPPPEGSPPSGDNYVPIVEYGDRPGENNNVPTENGSNDNNATATAPSPSVSGESNVTGGDVPRVIFGQEQSPYLPLEKPVRQDQIVPVSEAPVVSPPAAPEGVSRAFVAAAIADKLNLLELRKSLLDRCYADLENCTNIFRMYSSYDGIKTDANNLILFPDVNDLPEGDRINKMALLGIVQGYYGIEGSPFLPANSVSKVEALKILSTVLATFEKGNPDYKAEKFDYNSLFYQEIYGASLLAKENEALATAAFLPENILPVVKVAHALSEQAWKLIRAQTTPFKDIRPDLYDTHWYYPIVYNRLCSLKVFACTPGSNANPDGVPTSAEVNAYISEFDKYIKAQNLDEDIVKDSDDDGILNIDEALIYFTDSRLPDTDDDQLTDGDEISKYKTDPNLLDTDQDQLTDGDEIIKYKTDPNLADTDQDEFSDSTEITEGSNPLDKNSVPDDSNENAVSDKWEVKYNIEVKDGSQDTDGDGVSDILEYKYGTDPNRIDSDMDGYTDAEEILDILSNPVDASSPGSPEDLPVLINNFQYGQLVSEPSPLIKGIAPASLGDNIVRVQILLRNEFGSELQLGQTFTDAKGRFLFVPDIEIKNGTYFLMARAINKGEVKLSNPIKIVIDSTLQVATAKPEKLDSSLITDEVLLKKLVLKVDSKTGQPVLYGSLSEFGSRVNVTWQSLVVSSALIADTTDGSFSVKAPKLEAGRHAVYVQTVRKRDNAMGKTLKIGFDLGVVPTVGTPSQTDLIGKALQFSGKGVLEFISKQSWPFWIGVVVLIVLAGGGVYFFALGKEERKRKNKGKK